MSKLSLSSGSHSKRHMESLLPDCRQPAHLVPPPRVTADNQPCPKHICSRHVLSSHSLLTPLQSPPPRRTTNKHHGPRAFIPIKSMNIFLVQLLLDLLFHLPLSCSLSQSFPPFPHSPPNSPTFCVFWVWGCLYHSPLNAVFSGLCLSSLLFFCTLSLGGLIQGLVAPTSLSPAMSFGMYIQFPDRHLQLNVP